MKVLELADALDAFANGTLDMPEWKHPRSDTIRSAAAALRVQHLLLSEVYVSQNAACVGSNPPCGACLWSVCPKPPPVAGACFCTRAH